MLSIKQTYLPSEELSVIVGKEPITRPECVKRLWEYIKKNKRKDKVNKRMIIADAKLKPIFIKDKVSMFELAKIVTDNLTETK